MANLTVHDRYKELRTRLDAQVDALERVIPPGLGLTPQRVCQVVLDACLRQPGLLECSWQSLVRVVRLGASCGLEESFL